jgi:hypothetical protein
MVLQDFYVSSHGAQVPLSVINLGSFFPAFSFLHNAPATTARRSICLEPAKA